MRIHLAGSFVDLKPIILMYTDPGSHSFDKTLYPDHTIFQVMVIGGGGGYGGGLVGEDPTTLNHMVMYGGAGGGGGSHRIRGLLEYLDDVTPIVVGAGGVDGDDGGSDPDASTNGTNGEPSSFGDYVVATGGEGGRRVHSLDSTEDPLSNGGEGGVGGTHSWDYGGGGGAGIAGHNAGGPVDGDPGEDGGLFVGPIKIFPPGSTTGEQSLPGQIGKGGGGGAGGTIRHHTDDDTYERVAPFPTTGGRGSYNLDDLVFSPMGKLVSVQPGIDSPFLKGSPGRGGGARFTPFNRSNVTFGDGRLNRNGAVMIRLLVA